MTIAGYEILCCPLCTQLYKNPIIGSYNTFNSRYFSDGHLEGDYIPQMPSIIKCVNNDCGKFFNIEEAKKIAQIDNGSFDAPEWKFAHYLAGYNIGLKDLEEALTTDFCKNEEEEITVRTLLLRRYNDYFRQDKEYKFSLEENESFLYNIERLIELYKNENNTSGKLFLAELYREKNEFDLCLEVLNGISNEKENEKTVREKIYSQAKVKDHKVFNIHAIAIKIEYKCDKCGESVILFDLSKMKSQLDYKYFKCKVENKIFNAPSKEKNPVDYKKPSLMQKILKTSKTYENIIEKTAISCPTCNGTDIELFNAESQNCIKCNTGRYDIVKWFD